MAKSVVQGSCKKTGNINERVFKMRRDATVVDASAGSSHPFGCRATYKRGNFLAHVSSLAAEQRTRGGGEISIAAFSILPSSTIARTHGHRAIDFLDYQDE